MSIKMQYIAKTYIEKKEEVDIIALRGYVGGGMRVEKKSDAGHSFEDYFKRAMNPLIILSILMERPKYAYEMTQELKQRSGGLYQMPLLYPVLYRLEKSGYVEISETVISEKNRTRNYYRITEAGKDYLDACVAQYEALTVVANQFLGLDEGEKA